MSPTSPVAGDLPGPDRAGRSRKSPSRRRAVIYTRTAAPTSAESRHHQAQQEEECRLEADRLGLEVIGVFSDVGAAGRVQAGNPGWARVEALIRSRAVDVVLTANFDRLTRSWADTGTLYSLSVEFNVEFRTPSGDLTDDLTIAARHVARKAPPAERRRPRPGGAPGHPRPTEGGR